MGKIANNKMANWRSLATRGWSVVRTARIARAANAAPCKRLLTAAAFAASAACIQPCYAMDEEAPAAPKALSLSQAKNLLRELITALDRDDISNALGELVMAAQGDPQLTMQLVMPFVNKVQAQVLAKHGFEASGAGVVAFGRAVGPHRADGEVRQLLAVFKTRMMPSQQQVVTRAVARRERERLGVHLHDMEDNGAMCWSLPPSSIEWGANQSVKTDIEGVPGSFVATGVLTAAECKQMIEIADAMGFAPNEGITLGQGVRRNQSTQWWTGPEIADKFFARLRPHLPATVHGYRLCGLNMRFCVYKYAPGVEELLPHFDDGWEGTTMGWEEDCLAHWEAGLEDADDDDDAPDLDDHEKTESKPAALDPDDPRNERQWVSRMSVLLDLNSVAAGGTTNFWSIDKDFKPDPNCSYEENLKAATTLEHCHESDAGSALCFFHGAHEQSVLYSGEKVSCDEPRYVLRTDVMYLSPGMN